MAAPEANVARIAFITQKRTSLQGQLNNLVTTLTSSSVDQTQAQLRLTRVTHLLHAYEELHDELSLIDPQNEGIVLLEELQNIYYEAAGQIQSWRAQESPRNDISSATGFTGASTLIERQKLLKLPVAKLPTFSGDHTEWLSFFNTFAKVVGERTDIDDVVKFQYLQGCIHGEAANKIKHLIASGSSYEIAWTLLRETYERPRILISKHLDALIDIATPTSASPKELSQLVDRVRQNLSSLNSLGVRPEQRLIIRILERALPPFIREKWEESLTLDSLPSLDEFYTFINETIFRMYSLQEGASKLKTRIAFKRPKIQPSRPEKFRKNNKEERTFVTGMVQAGGSGNVVPTSEPSCGFCSGDHPTYKCVDFGKWNLSQRWNVVKDKGLCRNCLNKHRGQCRATHCKHCTKYHHSSLHAHPKTNIESLTQSPARTTDQSS